MSQGQRKVRESADDPRRARWTRLAKLFDRMELGARAGITAADAREITGLYRAVSSDLLVELRHDPDGEVAEYLRALVARGHSLLHRGTPPRILATIGRFFARDFPETVRRRIRPLLLASILMFCGAIYGGVAITMDPGAGEVLLVLGNRGVDPHERVVKAERESTTGALPRQALEGSQFAGWLVQNNVRVTFLLFALAATGGIGTALVLFANGAFLGAVAAKYLAAGEGLFLTAWIGPHGVLEIPAVLLGGCASFVVARALFAPGIAGRARAMAAAGRDALTILLGASATLLVAGLIEGTISQLHEPLVPYPAKIAFASILFVAYTAYLAFAPGVPWRRATPAESR